MRLPRFAEIKDGDADSSPIGRCLRIADPDGIRSVLPRQVVNFAGYLVILPCTCGSGCHYNLLWDARTGEVIKAPYGSLFTAGLGAGQKEEDYRPDSRLLVASGAFREDGRMEQRTYLWSRRTFRLLNVRTIPR